MPALSVLVVDNDPSVRAALVRLLEGRAYEVSAVETRSEAFELLDEQPFDLLILDDPGHERCYRLVWLTEDVPDSRVELVDLNPDTMSEQLEVLFPDLLASSGVVEFDSAVDAALFDSADSAA